MQLVAILFIILNLSSIYCESLECKGKRCSCYNYEDKLEIICGQEDSNILFNYMKRENKLQMHCFNMLNMNNTDLPTFNITIEELTVFYCPLMQSYNKLTQDIGVKSKKLGIDSIKSSNEKLTRNHFYGLDYLELLKIENNNIHIEEDFLSSTPQLNYLNMHMNKINGDFPDFTYVPNLEYLDISRGGLLYLSDTLNNLTKLQHLYLFSNKIKKITKSMFLSLSNLRLLELSSNEIEYLEKDSFTNLRELRILSLRHNSIKNISRDLFENSEYLYEADFGLNKDLILEDYTFSNFSNLSVVILDRLNLKEVPENIFKNSWNIRKIVLNNNELTDLPKSVFYNLKNLEELSLSFNKIQSLPDMIFSSLTSLLKLDLSNNMLTVINQSVFNKLIKLNELDVSHNKINVISNLAFVKLSKVKSVNISHNNFEMNEDIFSNCVHMEILDLSFNNIKDFFNLDTLTHLKQIDWSHNQISYIYGTHLIGYVEGFKINLSNNNIKRIDLSLVDATEAENYNKVDIGNNPISCDCHNLDLIKYFNGLINERVPKILKLENYEDINCANPSEYKHIKITDIKPEMLGCRISDITKYEECPKQCDCFWKPYASTCVVDCSSKNLTNVPVLKIPKKIRFGHKSYDVLGTEVYLENNLLFNTPSIGFGYENVTKLHLSNNNIRNLSWIPPYLEVLDLDHNKLESISPNILKYLNKTIKSIKLGNNPWLCDCAASPFQEYVIYNSRQVDPNQVLCNETRLPITQIKTLCKSYSVMMLSIGVTVVLFFLLIATAFALYYKYQIEIKIWLYDKNLCLWFVSEEELDKDKEYDVFVCFSHKDEDFVMETMVPVLESEPNPFKVCIHVRDFIPGEEITTQIIKSVMDSRRTMVVLTNHFLESCWAKMEFRTAHTQAINEKRSRVIVVILGDINEDKLDDELKAYLKTNTYVKWGDPWFWQKINYALPHYKHKNHAFTQKHANMMQSIDDKFVIVKAPIKSNPLSTPPISTLDVNTFNEEIHLRTTKLIESE